MSKKLSHDEAMMVLARKLAEQDARGEHVDIRHAATMLVHWPSGPVACCDEHGQELLGLGDFLGTHIVVTGLTEPAACENGEQPELLRCAEEA